MAEDLFEGQSFAGVDYHNLFEEIFGVGISEVIWEIEICPGYPFVCFFDPGGLEGSLPAEHEVHDNSGGPDIDFVGMS